MKTERNSSFRVLSFVMALLVLLSSMPTHTAAAEWQSENLVIDNDSNDNEYAVNGTGDSKTDTIVLSAGKHTMDQKAATVYYSFVAPSDGDVTITIATSQDSFSIMYYPDGANGSYTSLNLGVQPETTEMGAGDTVVWGVKICTSKWGGALAGTVTMEINFTSNGNQPPVACQHTEKVAVPNNDGTHNIVCAEDGCDYVETANVACTDVTTVDHKCDACGYVMGQCSVSTYTDLKNGTHQAYCVCGKEVGEPVEHTYDETTLKCVCGAEKPDCDHSYVGVQTKEPTCTEKGVMTYTCSKCGNSYTEEIDSQGHELSEWEEKTAPTCTESGEKTRGCSRCSYVETEAVDANGHKDDNGDYICDVCKVSICENHVTGTKEENRVPATSCTAGGSYELVTYCLNCGEVITRETVLTPALAHTYAAYTRNTDPGCTTLGSEIASCIYGCGETKTRYVMPLGHNFVDGVCTDCDATEASVGTVDNPEQFIVGDNTGVAPTTGNDKYYYFVFNAVMDGTVIITPNADEWYAYTIPYAVDGKQQPQTYHRSVNGVIEMECELSAGQKVVLKITNSSGYSALGGEITVNFQFTTKCEHSFVTDGSKATCTEDGSVGYTCSVCNTSYAEYTRKLGHDMGEYTETKAPNCTEKGEETSYCSRCDHTDVREVAANGHSMGAYTQTKAPTCTAAGEETATCSICGHIETKTVPANGHSSSSYVQNKAPTCTEPGEETATCSVCGETDTRAIDPLGHDTVTVEHKDATCTDDGVVGGSYCARCEADKDAEVNEVIPATGHTYVEGKCSCGAEDPNYIPEGTEGNPKEITEGEHIVTVDRYASYYYIYTADKEGALTITVSGEYWAANVFRYNADGKKLADNVDVRRAYAEDSNVFTVALEAGEKIMLQVSTYKGGIMPGGEITSVLAFASCDHIYDANCEDGDCNSCGGTRVAPGHDWSKKDGVCVTCGFVCQCDEYDDGFCTTCGKECDHNWTNATCTTPKTCSECKMTDGEALGHDWSKKDGVCVTCSFVCEHGDLTETCPICGKAPEMIGVAQIGNVSYATLGAAIEAAKDSDTIVLLSDLELNCNDAQLFAPETENKFKTMFVVEGKTITIDLNGKTIFVDATTGFGEGIIEGFPENDVGMIDWKADRLQGMLLAVITTYNGGHLTLNDSVGAGGIKTEAYSGSGTSCGIVYSVLANYSDNCPETGEKASSITINGGKYEADITRDCLVYTHASANEGVGNTGVVVHGGYFTLGNAGQGRNFSTWIFNAKGGNERHVWVTGGTFSTDIHHQYWIFEVQGPETRALCKNTDGTYTMVDAVAYVAERHGQYTKNVGYTTLEEAIAACADDTYRKNTYYSSERYDQYANEDKVVLLTNIVLDKNIEIPAGKSVTVDMNGFTITGGEIVCLPMPDQDEGENSESET